MPIQANQLVSLNQRINLPTERVVSNIPKGGTNDGTWIYPSPQMFWNALVRKDKTADASEEYMETVVAIHNNMNENTWKQVLAWEALHPPKKDVHGSDPKLLRFLGRPDELSPKAKILTWLGLTPPFDRHDWIVDRGGKEVRYVIDYYHDEKSVRNDKLPKHITDAESIQSIVLDVRPALDSFEAILDRIVSMPLARFFKRTEYVPLPVSRLFSFDKISIPITNKKVIESPEQLIQKQAINKILIECDTIKQQYSNCISELDCQKTYIELQRCIGNIVCPQKVENFNFILKHSNDSKLLETTFEEIENGINEFKKRSSNNKN